ncbi:MAG: acyl-CoA ligase (AMP-forming) (exosortase A-associated) [Gammaproteobacteria bacterium]|jgi:acyl-CoA ligase (AMP-forming) (exosortase A-associated)
MSRLLHETLLETVDSKPDAPLLRHNKYAAQSFGEFLRNVEALAKNLIDAGLAPNDRVGIYLEKQPLAPTAFYATTMAGGVFVPLNPILKPQQVAYILRDCNVKLLVTSPQRYAGMVTELSSCPDLETIVLSSELPNDGQLAHRHIVWNKAPETDCKRVNVRRIDHDMAAILYTSGSTGKPKGVIISHRNIVAGAVSVSDYLSITSDDRLLAVLPFSFDYGLNQLTSAVLNGSTCVLLDYLLPNDVIKAVVKFGVTGLAAVPPLWSQLAHLDWPTEARDSLRYFTNTGGSMPEQVLQSLREKLPTTAPVLMYGLTEAFRSTYLPPDEIDNRRGSIGKAIPNAEILVVGSNGEIVGPNEPGELVHRGALVSLGYWNDPARTAERFKPVPGSLSGLPMPEIAVWSGDTVTSDEAGFLYFVGRTDSMLKTSGYRVSPEEIEEVAYANPNVIEAAAIGIADISLGQAIVLVVCVHDADESFVERLIAEYRKAVPAYMVPSRVVNRDSIPHNANGKIDRKSLSEEYSKLNETYDTANG